MFSSVISGGINGIDCFLVNVEADISDGLPMFELVGYLSAEVREARERVRTAMRNAGYSFPVKRVTINLAPGNIKKSGTGYDLPMSVAVLAAMQAVNDEWIKDTLIAGELLLNGDVGGIRGVLPMVIEAKRKGLKRCIVPRVNAKEGAVVDGIDVYGVGNLSEIIELLNNKSGNAETMEDAIREDEGNDFKYVRGQAYAKRGIEIAAAGLHNLLMSGPPGSGKSMLAKCIPSILPPLLKDEQLEVSAIYSVAGLLRDGNYIIDKRPFIAPHHTATDIAMTGGGSYPRPGNISLAHNGVLFLDEMPEFSRYTLESLRQPMEDKKITITRINGVFSYPASFMLVGAMNPCPCGNYPDLSKCRCTDVARNKYVAKISGPLMDRIDICINVEKVDLPSILDKSCEEDSATIRTRVMQAHAIQRKRFEGTNIHFNSQMNSEEITKYCILEDEAKELLTLLVKKYDLSARSYFRVLKISRTIADLADSEEILSEHISEAIRLKSKD